MRGQQQLRSKICASCGAQLALAAEPAIKQPANSPTTPKFAGFWFRTLAAVIDTVLCQVAVVILVLPLGFALGASMAGTFSLSEIEAAGLSGFDSQLQNHQNGKQLLERKWLASRSQMKMANVLGLAKPMGGIGRKFCLL